MDINAHAYNWPSSAYMDVLLGRLTLMGLSGFEPLTPALSAQCSNQLSYRPESWTPLTAEE